MAKKYLALGILAVAIIALVFASGCMQVEEEQNDTDVPELETADISVAFYAYDPTEITIAKGTEVTWTNNDPKDIPYTVVSEDLFDGGELMYGDSFSFTFEEVGEYEYGCTNNPSMVGKIIVE